MADLEEGEISDSDDDSHHRALQKHRWRSRSTSNQRKEKADLSFSERTRSSSSHKQSTSSNSELRSHKRHSCDERSFCRRTFHPQHCLVRNKKFKHKQSSWDDSWRDHNQGKDVRVGTSKRDKSEKGNILKNKKTPKCRKEVVGRGNVSKDEEAVFSEFSRSCTVKTTVSRKQTLLITHQNDENPLMHKLITAGLAKTSSSGSSNLHTRGSLLSDSNPELDIWTDYSTLSDGAAGDVPVSIDSDSDIEVVIPPEKIPTVVTLDSDGEEVNEATTGNFENVSLNKNQTSTENLNKTLDEKNNRANKSLCGIKDESDIPNVSKLSDNNVSKLKCSDDETLNYNASSPPTPSSAVVFAGDEFSTAPIEDVATSNLKELSQSTKNTSINDTGTVSSNQNVNFIETCETKQDEGRDCIIDPSPTVNEQLTTPSGRDQAINQPKQINAKNNLVGNEEHIVGSDKVAINEIDLQSAEQKNVDDNIATNHTLESSIKNCDRDSDPNNTFSLCGKGTQQSQDSYLSNNNTSNVKHFESCTTTSPISSYLENIPNKDIQHSISNLSGSHNYFSCMNNVGSSKRNDLIYAGRQLHDENEHNGSSPDYELAAQDKILMVSNNTNLCSFQSKDKLNSSDTLFILDDNLNNPVSSTSQDNQFEYKNPLSNTNINVIHKKQCSNKDFGQPSDNDNGDDVDDDDDDLSKLRLIALSTKKKSDQNAVSEFSNNEVACCKDSDSNASGDLLVNEEEDVLKLRVEALKSAFIKKHEERKKMGIVIKKRQRKSSSLVDDLIPNDSVSNDNLILAPPSPAKSTKSMCGEEDMEISDSNSDIMNQDSISDASFSINCNSKISGNSQIPYVKTCDALNDSSILKENLCLSSETMVSPTQSLLPKTDVGVRDSVLPYNPPIETMLPCLLHPPPPPPFPPSDDSNLSIHDSGTKSNLDCVNMSSIPLTQEEIDLKSQTESREIHRDTSDQNLSNDALCSVNLANECLTPLVKGSDPEPHTSQTLQCQNMYSNTSSSKNKKMLGKQNSIALKRTLQVIPLVKKVPTKLSSKKNKKKLSRQRRLKNKNKFQPSSQTSESEFNVLCITDESFKLNKKGSNTLVKGFTPLCTTNPPANRIQAFSSNDKNKDIYCKDTYCKESPTGNDLIESNECEMDLSEMIVLDEVGMSPEHVEDEHTPRVQTQRLTSSSNLIPTPCFHSKKPQMRPVAKSSAGVSGSSSNTSNQLISSGAAASNNVIKPVIQEARFGASTPAQFSSNEKVVSCQRKYETAESSLQNHAIEHLSSTHKVDVSDSNKYKLLRALNEPRRCVVQGRHSLKVVVPSDSAPVVERLIIKVGQDSDSEDDSEWLRQVRVQDPAPVPPGPVIDEDLERSIDHLLMTARQNSDKRSLQSPKPAPSPADNDDIADTPLKLLPKETQEEYQRLKKIIEEKEKQNRLRTSLRNKELKRRLGASDTSNTRGNNQTECEGKSLPKQFKQLEIKEVSKTPNTTFDKISQLPAPETFPNRSCKGGQNDSVAHSSPPEVDVISSEPCSPNNFNKAITNNSPSQSHVIDGSSDDLHSDKPSLSSSSSAALVNDNELVGFNKNEFKPKEHDHANQTNSIETLDSPNDKSELQAYKKAEELAFSHAKLLNERFMVVDSATQVSEEINELECQIAQKTAAEVELQRLRKLVAQVESQLESIRSKVGEQRLKVVDLLGTLEAREECVAQVERGCCLLGSQLYSQGYQLPSTGKDLMVKKLHQVRDKSGKLLNKALTYDNKLDSLSDKEQALKNLARPDMAVPGEASQCKANIDQPTIEQLEETSAINGVHNPTFSSNSSFREMSPDDSLICSTPTLTVFSQPELVIKDKPELYSPFDPLSISINENQSKNSKIALSEQRSKQSEDPNLTSNNLHEVSFKRPISEVCEVTSMHTVKRPNTTRDTETLPGSTISNSLRSANAKSLVKYKSLLRYKESFKRLNDDRSSMDVLCPFDLSGKCQDSLCPYRHLQTS